VLWAVMVWALGLEESGLEGEVVVVLGCKYLLFLCIRFSVVRVFLYSCLTRLLFPQDFFLDLPSCLHVSAFDINFSPDCS